MLFVDTKKGPLADLGSFRVKKKNLIGKYYPKTRLLKPLNFKNKIFLFHL